MKNENSAMKSERFLNSEEQVLRFYLFLTFYFFGLTSVRGYDFLIQI